MSLTEPIVEGAYYEREDGQVFGPARPAHEFRGVYGLWDVGGLIFSRLGACADAVNGYCLTRRVWLVPTDPAEVVAELRSIANAQSKDVLALVNHVSDLVAEKLGWNVVNIDPKQIMAEVRANLALLDACPRHKFTHPAPFTPGGRSVCSARVTLHPIIVVLLNTVVSFAGIFASARACHAFGAWGGVGAVLVTTVALALVVQLLPAHLRGR